jgi:hypothetical protein
MIPDHKRLTASFFRGVNSLDLFKRFFEKYKVWSNLNLQDKPKNDAVYEAWANLIHPSKKEIEEQLLCINDISGDDGRDYLVDVAAELKLDFQSLTTPRLAITLFLDHFARFKTAYDRNDSLIEILETSRVIVGMPARHQDCDAAMAAQLRFVHVRHHRSVDPGAYLVAPVQIRVYR